MTLTTPAQLLDLEVRRRTETFRFDVLDKTLAKIGEVHPNRDTPPVIANTAIDTVKRTMTGFVIPPSEEADIDTIAHRIRVMYRIPEIGYEAPLGVFLYAGTGRHRRSYGNTLSSTLWDQWLMLDQKVRKPFSVRLGQRITDGMTALLLTTAGIKSFVVHPSHITPSNPMIWPPATGRRRILADMAKVLGYLVHFANDGTFIAAPIPDLDHTPPDLVYATDTGKPSRIVDDSIDETDDLWAAPNVYLVISNGPNQEPIYGSYEIPASAPHSKVKRGFEVVKDFQHQGLPNNDWAIALAKIEAANDQYAFRFVEFDGPPDPRHDTYQVVRYLGENYYEAGWRLPCKPGGPHHHELRRIFA